MRTANRSSLVPDENLGVDGGCDDRLHPFWQFRKCLPQFTFGARLQSPAQAFDLRRSNAVLTEVADSLDYEPRLSPGAN